MTTKIRQQVTHTIICLMITLVPNVAMAFNQSTSLLAIFIPGLVFLTVAIFAISYSLTACIERLWLRLAIRVISISLIIAPTKVMGSNQWWPNGILLFSGQELKLTNALLSTLVFSLLLLSLSYLLLWLASFRSKV